MSEKLQELSRESANKVEYLLPLMLFLVPCGDSWTRQHFWSFLKKREAEKKNQQRQKREIPSAFRWSKRQKRKRRTTSGSLSTLFGFLVSTGVKGSENTDKTFDLNYKRGSEQLYHRCIHHLLAWGVGAFPQLINILRVRLAVRVTVFPAVFLDT